MNKGRHMSFRMNIFISGDRYPKTLKTICVGGYMTKKELSFTVVENVACYTMENSLEIFQKSKNIAAI